MWTVYNMFQNLKAGFQIFNFLYVRNGVYDLHLKFNSPPFCNIMFSRKYKEK
jgi:hypothetical protein